MLLRISSFFVQCQYLHLCNARPLDNIVKDNKFASQILHILPDDDSLDVKTGKHLIQLLNLALM